MMRWCTQARLSFAKVPNHGQLNTLMRYPLKSTAGWSVEAAELSPRGLRDDRRWMVVDEAGEFVTARHHGALLTVQAEPRSAGELVLRCAELADDVIAAPSFESSSTQVRVWGDRCQALDMGDEAAQWISQVVDRSCRVVYMPDETKRPVSGVAATPGDIVSFADGYPVLLTLQESLDAFNEGLDEPVAMACFRPNVVVSGLEAFSEHSWSSVRIGELDFTVAGPCVRCQMTTRDQHTGRRRRDGEPLKTLAQTRRTDDGVIFGINLIPRATGTLRLGDRVTPTLLS